MREIYGFLRLANPFGHFASPYACSGFAVLRFCESVWPGLYSMAVFTTFSGKNKNIENSKKNWRI